MRRYGKRWWEDIWWNIFREKYTISEIIGVKYKTGLPSIDRIDILQKNRSNCPYFATLNTVM